MTLKLTPQEGEFLVRLARNAVKAFLSNGLVLKPPKNSPAKLQERHGVFVTINSIEKGAKVLRGCIGYPSPTTILVQAVIECAISSATQDPRFLSVTLKEIDHLIFEVSVLSLPELLAVETPRLLPSSIEIGRDGIIVEKDSFKGLLLPQVPVEYHWEAQDFLSHGCMKAGLTPDCWLLKETKIMTFQCIIASEVTPEGVVELKGPNLV